MVCVLKLVVRFDNLLDSRSQSTFAKVDTVNAQNQRLDSGRLVVGPW
jgi:hypothetical protein